jgi:hypothetical protein
MVLHHLLKNCNFLVIADRFNSYVEYFYQVLKNKKIPEQKPLYLKQIVLKNLPSIYFFPATSGMMTICEIDCTKRL